MHPTQAARSLFCPHSDVVMRSRFAGAEGIADVFSNAPIELVQLLGSRSYGLSVEQPESG
ncbi:MAG: hypothetical protein J0L70_21390 [Leptolyngbya sp. UWPOB_LEPTO1]|uniref:hypothetical protein n=1 Tax=Leptolyngbya sp. UWPOB_LEPTO1 TaxID=2815653 RepID=UPI001AD435A5|nr:hypothetical protein [Leptolyngbya sp. UWPOB_LEPTO1]MBN8563094.1 hypothetical protein [Leptolyngbya sp. UWPOB_LEPTO1]